LDATIRILHLEDEPLDSELATESLSADGMQVQLDRVDTLPDLENALRHGVYQLVLSDYTLPSVDPLEALRVVRQRYPDIPFIFFSGTIGEDRATQALKLGASDYVLKQRIEQLSPTVRRALAEAREQRRRREAEAALRRSEERLRLAQEVAGIGTFDWDFRSGLIEWSGEMESLYGGAGERTFAGWLTRLHPDDRAEAREAVEKAIRSGAFEAEWRIALPDGSTRWLAGRGHVFKDQAGEPLRMVGVNIDITQRKMAEEEIKAARITAERAKEVAEEASRAKDRFLAILSHELRTPLTAVMPALDAIEPFVPGSAREYLEMASRNVELEARLIDDLLDITRIARGKVELHRETVDLCDVLRRAADVCRSEIEARHIHFAMRAEDAPHLVHADPARLQQVFWNLIQNAVKFTPIGGCIGVYAQKRDGLSVIEVADSGTGIEGDALARIFNAFEQEAKSITRQFGGLGLGLAISKALTELHGGTIGARSDGKGRGASFTVTLPLVEPAEAARPRSRPAAMSNKPSQLRILLVEDHADTARILSILLRKEGHHVQHAPDTATGFQLARENDFDLLISDLGLPDGSGHDLMRKLLAANIQLPAVALSGYGTAADIQRSRDVGFREHVVKPVNLAALRDVISRVTAQPV
jgi:PAS domain S-box-containing protein